MGGNSTLQQVMDLIARDPHSAPALTLYALVNTLEFPKAGCLFRLDKLKALDAGQRQLAFQLIEIMLAGQAGSTEWQRAKGRMDELVKNA